MSEYKIPEQVLQENLKPKLETLEGAVNAMKEYGRQEAVGFLEWVVDNYSIDYEGFRLATMENKESYIWDSDTETDITLSELYQRYKQKPNEQS